VNRWRALFERNKRTAAILGAVAVGGFALVARRRAAMGSTSTSSTGTSSGPAATTSTYSASGQPAVYDSTGTDVYNALQPQIEQLQQLARQIPVAGSTTPATPTSWTASETDPRRTEIITDYQSMLGRDPSRSEVNFWDTGGRNLSDIHALIGQSQEAQGAK